MTKQTGFFVYLPFLLPDQVALLVQKYRATSYYGDGRSVLRVVMAEVFLVVLRQSCDYGCT